MTWDIKSVEARIKQITVVEIKRDGGLNSNKCLITLGLPLVKDDPSPVNDYEQFFNMDPVKNYVIELAEKEFNKQAGWSGISTLKYFNEGVQVNPNEECDEIRVQYSCASAR